MEPLLTFDVLKQRFLRSYYWLNFALCLYPILLRPLLVYYEHLKPQDWWSSYDLRIYGVVVFFLIAKLRRVTSLEETVGVFFLYIKLANCVSIYFLYDYLWVSFYVAVLIIAFSLVPQPHYNGPSLALVIERDQFEILLKEAKKEKKDIYIVACLEVDWSPRCVNMQAVFASLSLKYTCDRIQFVRVALDEILEKEFKIDGGATSLQIPSIILFHNGEEVERLPNIKSRFRGAKISFWDRSEESIVEAFGLNQLFEGDIDKLD